ncbi:MAG: EamA family transporter [Acinetobacter sp.]
MAGLSRHHLVFTYILLVMIWATTPLAIVWSVSDLNIFWALIFRFLLALPSAFLILKVLKIEFPFTAQAMHSYVAGAFSLIGSQFFTYLATQYLNSGMIALMFGLSPIIAGLIGWGLFNQRLQLIQWCGMFVALAGLAMICLSRNQQHIHPLGILIMLVSVFNYALSIFWVKKINAPLKPMAQATGSILVSTLFALLIIPFIWSSFPHHFPSIKSILSIIYTVVMASLLAMFCYFKLVQNIQPTTLSLTNVMTPLLALIVGALLNHEMLTLQVFVGASILMMGLLLYFYRDLTLHQQWRKRFNKQSF